MTQLTSLPSNVSLETETTDATAPQAASATYLAPAIESVFTSDDMAREVFYAGAPVSNPGPVNPV